MMLKCGKCSHIGEAEEITVYVKYKCKKCGTINEIFNVPLKAWLGFNFLEYSKSIDEFIEGYDFDDLVAKSATELKLGKLSQSQVSKLRKVLRGGFASELSIRQIADKIQKDVNPKDLFRMKDGKKVLSLSAGRRPIAISRTETTRAGAEGSLLHYEKGKVKKVVFTASMGERTCPQCMSRNGEVMTLVQANGIIPLHPFCRCAFVPTSDTESISPINNFKIYKNISEKVNISFRDEEQQTTEQEETNENIQDYKAMLQTGEEGFASIVTEKINGILVAVICSVQMGEMPTTLFYNLEVSSAETPSVVFFDEKNISREEIFVPLKVDYYNVNLDDFKGQPDFWVLNERLLIQFSGMKNLTANIKLRYKKW